MKSYHKFTESIEDPSPQIGDYVICDNLYYISNELDNFLENNIGKIISIDHKNKFNSTLIIKYENIPNSIKNIYFKQDGTKPFDTDEIKYFSHNKEELETILNANKYNL